MTTGRVISRDVAQTKAIVEGKQPVPSRDRGPKDPNWLGHTKGCAQIDFDLITGATLKELGQHRGAVGQHLKHLKEDHGLDTGKGDIRRFIF